MYELSVSVNELDNGHAKLIIRNPQGFQKEGEYPTTDEALDEAYKTLARERLRKWKS